MASQSGIASEKTSSVEEVETFPDNVDPEMLLRQKEKALIRKLDKRIIPVMILTYLMSYMDRVNIGNARLYGLEEDLGLVGNQYQLCVSIMFVTYCLFEIPSNLIIKKMNPARYLAFITVEWGICATMCGVVQNLAGMVACRLLLGFFEAGLFPDLILYLTMFYTRRELGLRGSYLFATAALAGSVGGLLAYAIGTPDTISLLTDEDRELLKSMHDRDVVQNESARQFHKKDMIDGFKDFTVWLFGAAHFCLCAMTYTLNIYLPTVINGLGA